MSDQLLNSTSSEKLDYYINGFEKFKSNFVTMFINMTALENLIMGQQQEHYNYIY